MNLILILFAANYLNLHTWAQDRVLLKTRQSKPFIGNGIIGEKYSETDYMPGNDGFGFFIKVIGEKNAICRIRLKIGCDYGFGNIHFLKNKKIQLSFQNNTYESNSDDTGLADLLFKCDPKVQDYKSTITYLKIKKDFVLKNAPKEIFFTEKDCK